MNFNQERMKRGKEIIVITKFSQIPSFYSKTMGISRHTILKRKINRH
jgi:hypothetical protein